MYIYIYIHETGCKTCINRSCSETETLCEGQTRFIPSVFYMLPFYTLLKRKP